LKEVLAGLPRERHPDLLVGLDTSDDAGVVRLFPDLALIQTVDFFTPIVDDPYWFGAIAAANSLSDVYAMGGTPLTALNIVCFPIKELPGEILAEILRGGSDKIREAGVHLAGGHSVDDPEPKYGLSVTGTVHPAHIATNAGAQPGDVIVLTKPLGTGILTTAAKQDSLDAETLQIAISQMATLNRGAAEAMRQVGIGPEAGVHAATDITGFGLLGHLSHMVKAANVGIRLRSNAIPLLPRAQELAAAGLTTGGGNANRQYLADMVRFADTIPVDLRDVLVDPQTSGGLCIITDPSHVDALIRELTARKTVHTGAWMIGEVTGENGIEVAE
jgi:selenide,water dikinase